MGNLFTRIKDSVAADFHELLDQKEQKNPTAQLNQYVRECEEQTKKIRHLVEKQYQLKQEFSREYNFAKSMAEKRKKQVEMAKEASEFELAEQAESEQHQYEERLEKVNGIRENAIEELETLETKYVQMKHKLKDLYVKQMELKGRENVAQAHKGMNKVLHSDLDATKSTSRFAELEQYIEKLENQVNSDHRLHTLDARLAEMEKDYNKNIASTS